MRASFSPAAAVITVKTMRPSGRAEGHQWPISSRVRSGVVRMAGCPASVDTIESPASQVLENTIRSRPIHVAPGPPRASQIGTGSPPLVGDLVDLAIAEKADPFAVRRCKRPARALGTRAGAATSSVSRLSQKQPRLTFDLPFVDDEATVGGERDIRDVADIGRRFNGKANDAAGIARPGRGLRTARSS